MARPNLSFFSSPTSAPTPIPAAGQPWYQDFTVIFGLALLFYFMLRLLMHFSNNWRKMMAARIDKALQLRKNHKDPFRGVNGYSWDFVMVFKIRKFDDKQTPKQLNPLFSVKGLLDLLAESGLQTKLFYSVQNDELYCKIRAPLKRITEEAERTKYRLLLDSSAAANALALGCSEGPSTGHWSPIQLPLHSEETHLDPFAYIYGRFTKSSFEKYDLYKKYNHRYIIEFPQPFLI